MINKIQISFLFGMVFGGLCVIVGYIVGYIYKSWRDKNKRDALTRQDGEGK